MLCERSAFTSFLASHLVTLTGFYTWGHLQCISIALYGPGDKFLHFAELPNVSSVSDCS